MAQAPRTPNGSGLGTGDFAQRWAKGVEAESEEVGPRAGGSVIGQDAVEDLSYEVGFLSRTPSQMVNQMVPSVSGEQTPLKSLPLDITLKCCRKKRLGKHGLADPLV